MRKAALYMRLLLVAAIASLFMACASMGHPEGGPRDELPPTFLSSKPIVGARNVTRNKIEISFNENIQLEDVTNKVIVSPAQKTTAAISAQGKKVVVELRDTLIPNMTYTVDFSDAIRDLNESNILDGFAFDFSTGDSIDSLCISGMLFEARTLEPAQGMLVGVYSNLSDTAITTLPMDRITKTNQLGQFTIRNLKPGEYRVFAVNDANRDYHWDRSEDVAFYDSVVSPIAETIEVRDTLCASDGSDSIVTRQGTQYLPNDILLSWFNEGYKAQYMVDHKREARNRISFTFAAPSDTLPEITIINGANAGKEISQWAKLNASATLDTLEYWISDPDVLLQDSLLVAARYLHTDTLDELSWTTDTIRLFFRDTEKKKKSKKKEEVDSVETLNFLNFAIAGSSVHELYLPLQLRTTQPLDTILPEGVHLDLKDDTLWIPQKNVHIIPDSARHILTYTLPYDWEPGGRYRLTIDSASIIGIYNEWNKPIKQEFSVRNTEDYANLFFKITGTDKPVVVELLNQSDVVVKAAPVIDGYAEFLYVLPGTYYARAFIDENGNGEYDTGNISLWQQPEEVYYFSKNLNVKKNWDIEQSWDLCEIPIDQQKPLKIKKNKPKKSARDSYYMPEEEEEDEYGENNSAFGVSNLRYYDSK